MVRSRSHRSWPGGSATTPGPSSRSTSPRASSRARIRTPRAPSRARIRRRAPPRPSPPGAATTASWGCSPAKVFLAVWDAAARPGALATASALRAAGIPTEVYLGGERMGEQLGYASSRGIPYAVLRGPKEREQGVVTLRDLQTREQAAVPEGDLTAVLRDRLST